MTCKSHTYAILFWTLRSRAFSVRSADMSRSRLAFSDSSVSTFTDPMMPIPPWEDAAEAAGGAAADLPAACWPPMTTSNRVTSDN